MKSNEYAVTFAYEVESTETDFVRGFAEFSTEYCEHETTETIYAPTLAEAMATIKADAPKGVTPLYVIAVSRNNSFTHRVAKDF